jgi:hypothetical protein
MEGGLMDVAYLDEFGCDAFLGNTWKQVLVSTSMDIDGIWMRISKEVSLLPRQC